MARRRPKKIAITPFKLPKYKPSRNFGKPGMVTFQDGPLAGRHIPSGLKLEVPNCYASRTYGGTLTICIRGESGFYSPAGRWIREGAQEVL